MEHAGTFTDNPMGIHWTGIVFGLGWVISFGYWTTDFLVVQRVCGQGPAVGEDGSDHRRGLQDDGAVHRDPAGSAGPGRAASIAGRREQRAAGRRHSYNEVLPLMLARYCGPGLLGLGITALIAGFMSGMAGNVSAFATVWTYDIYQAFIRKEHADDRIT